MPVTVPVVRSGNVVVPQSIPAGVVRSRATSGNYVFDVVDDLFDPGLPEYLGGNVLASPRVVSPRFAGMHYHVQRPTVSYSVARNVDMPGCMWSSVAAAGRGLYDWTSLDAFVSAASAARRDV